MVRSPLADSLASLSRLFVADGTLVDTLTRVAHLTVDAVPGGELAGITMPVGHRYRTAVYTDDIAPEVDRAQYDTGEGPCLDAVRTQQVTTIGSTLEDGRWPEFRRTAATYGVLSTMSFPLSMREKVVGALNVYARQERAFTETDAASGRHFADRAAVVLANAQAYWNAHELSTQLTEAMASRAVIEQAKGILMGSQRCSSDEAFNVLARASQRENVKVRTIARRIVDNAARSPAVPTPRPRA